MKTRILLTFFIILMILSCKGQKTSESGEPDFSDSEGLESSTQSGYLETNIDYKTERREDVINSLRTWTHASSYPFREDSIRIIAYGNGRFVAAGHLRIRLAYSDDGDTWHTVKTDVFGTSNADCLVYGKDRFVASAYGNKMAYSLDGETWILAENGGLGNYYVNDIAYGDGCFVAVGSADYKTGIIGYSNDGETWTLVEDDSLGIDYFGCVTYGNGIFVAGGTEGKGAYSSDGISWTAIPDYPFEEDARFITYGNGRFVAYAANFQSYTPNAFISDNGIDWAVITKFPHYTSYNIVYGNGIFIAVGPNASMAYSFDGEAWYAGSDGKGFTINALTGPGDNLGGIAYGNGRFVIGGGNGTGNSSKLAWCNVPVFDGEKITGKITVEKSPFQRVMFERTYDVDGYNGAIGQIDETAYAKNPEQYMRFLMEENKGWSFGDSLELLSKIKIDTGTGETWFSSHLIYDSVPSTYFWLNAYMIKADVLRAYSIPFTPNHAAVRENGENYNGEKMRSFSVLVNLPGNFNKTAWLYDVNGDGFDEIIGVGDNSSSTPYQLNLYIIGYDKDKDAFVHYLNVTTTVLNTAIGPEPIIYIRNQGVWGFRCLMGGANNPVWRFFTWNENEKKYTEREFISE